VVELPVGDPVPSSHPAEQPARVDYAGRRFGLRPVDPDADVDDLYAGSHGSPEVESLWTYMAYGPFAGRDAMREWLRTCAPTSDPLFLTVYERATGTRVGVTSFLNIRPSMRCLELGHIWYVPRVQGTGVNQEAVYLMLCEAFDRLGYRRVEWKCDSLNARSRRAALKLGFTFEGIFRQHMIVKGRNRDTAWFAMMDAEWPALKAGLEARISV
jgi:RimJ/RimL family protein N-acetyltransferase